MGLFSAGVSRRTKSLERFRGGQGQRTQGRRERSDRLNEFGDDLLMDPGGTADMFSEQFGRAAQGLAAPAIRDFGRVQAERGANISARFEGNASSEEGRALTLGGDQFSRNLSEALARLAGQQVNAGMDFTRMALGAGANATAEEDRLTRQILASILGQSQSEGSSFFGTLLGTAAGVATKVL